jgi:precorrin-8X/cobalt-precorrin-8 methylmutase
MKPYQKDPAKIYAESFATVRREARLDRFDAGLETVAIRLIHACGMIEVADRLAFSNNAFNAGRAALETGAPILCDCEMVGAGIIRRYLPANNQVLITLNNPSVPALAKEIGNTRSAAAVDLWRDQIQGAVVVIGNAPTALFHLLELLDKGWPKPALILGFPVGFVGAAESKSELASNARGCEFIALRGRRGGSAMASAAVNALAAGLPEEK